MFRKSKSFISLVIVLSFLFNFISPVFATESCRYCDFNKLYVGEDKFEGFNR